MKTYITKPKSIRKSHILGKGWSLSALDFVDLQTNNNTKILKDLLNDYGKGKDFEEKQFLSFKTSYKYLKTASLTTDNLLADLDSINTYEYIRPRDYQEFRNSKREIKKYDILYTSTGSNKRIGDCALASNDLKCAFSSHIFKLNLKDKKIKFYLFALLKSNYGKQACDLEIPKAGIMRRGGDRFLNLQIPFPTTANQPEPQKVQDLVSVLVQNIIDKEEQIKIKNQKIDELIEKELMENQKDKSSFTYSYPKISEIKAQGRLDTGLYERDFKKRNNLIESYQKGYFTIPFKNFKSGSTPKVRIFNPKNKAQKWVTPTNITDQGFYNPVETISTPKTLNLKKESLLFINRTSKGKKGEYVGITAFYDPKDYGPGFHNQGIYRVEEYTKMEKLFLTAFMNSKITREICGNRSFGSKMKEMKAWDLSKLIFPSFPDSKQQEIAKEYYNQVREGLYLDLDNYLEREKQRNQELGIYQLNMEIFDLREKLEVLVYKIVNEEKIKIEEYI